MLINPNWNEKKESCSSFTVKSIINGEHVIIQDGVMSYTVPKFDIWLIKETDRDKQEGDGVSQAKEKYFINFTTWANFMEMEIEMYGWSNSKED